MMNNLSGCTFFIGLFIKTNDMFIEVIFLKRGKTHSHQSRNNILHIYSKQILVQPQKEEM